MEYLCGKCGARFLTAIERYRCDCGGMLNLQYGKTPIDFERTAASCEHSLWKYADALPFGSDGVWRSVTLGEGGTPLVRVQGDLWAKADYYMPTLSFKDRGAAVLVAAAKRMGVTRAVADSSGNAGAAIAAYCARAGIECDVFVPESTSQKKLKQIASYGARLHRIAGTREDTAAAAIAAVERTGAFYASHIYNPLFWEGTKTYVYELYEQLGYLPQALVVPVGNGTLLMGAYLACTELFEWGYVDRLPRILAVQAARCAPILRAFEAGADAVEPVVNEGTLAEGIAIAAPARGAQILAAVRATGGDIVGVSEEAIADARKALALRGMYVEITSASNWAGTLVYFEKYPELRQQTVVFPLCGAGLKSE